MQFKVDFKIFIFIIIFYLTKQINIYAIILFFALIHELGHFIMGLIVGMKPQKIEIKPYGVSISFKIYPNDFNKKIYKGNLLELKKVFVAFAGPLINLLIVLFFINIKSHSNLLVIYSNFLLFLFNLIPIYPLDGGRIIKSLLYILFGKKIAEKQTNNISFIILLIITFIGSISIYILKNISIILIIITLWILYVKEDIYYRKKEKIYNLIEKTIEK